MVQGGDVARHHGLKVKCGSSPYTASCSCYSLDSNLTIPHKVSAMRFMDELHPAARRVAAINTVVVQADGRLLGMNNDGAGYIQSLRDSDATWRGDAGPTLVLGAGGAARAIVVALLDEGVPELRAATAAPAGPSAHQARPAVVVDRHGHAHGAERGVAVAKNSAPRCYGHCLTFGFPHLD